MILKDRIFLFFLGLVILNAPSAKAQYSDNPIENDRIYQERMMLLGELEKEIEAFADKQPNENFNIDITNALEEIDRQTIPGYEQKKRAREFYGTDSKQEMNINNSQDKRTTSQKSFRSQNPQTNDRKLIYRNRGADDLSPPSRVFRDY